MTKRVAFSCLILAASLSCAIADDVELRDLDISGSPCLQKPGGTATTVDGIARNTAKNRSPVPFDPAKIQMLDTAGFLRMVAGFDAVLKAHRRTEFTAADQEHLRGFESQIVSLTGYLNLAYAGPPESTNCGDKFFHDWHLEIFAAASTHHPQPGDRTPIICEITPRIERDIFRSGIRLQSLATFIRNRKIYQPTGHPARKVCVTGFLMWDDDHNGSADVGPTAQYVTPANGFHHPWRSTAWEIHPVLKVEVLESR